MIELSDILKEIGINCVIDWLIDSYFTPAYYTGLLQMLFKF